MQSDLSCPSCQTKFEIEKKDGKSDARSDWATRICFSDDVQWKSVKNWFKFKICSERLDLYLKCHETQCNAHFMFPYSETLELIFSTKKTCVFCRSCLYSSSKASSSSKAICTWSLSRHLLSEFTRRDVWGENLHVSPVYIIICWWYYEYYIYICFIYLIWCGGKVALSKLYRSVSVQTELIFIQLKGRRIERNTSWTTLILVIHGGIGLLPYRDLTIWEQHKATTQGCSRGWYDWYLYVLCGHPGVYAFHCSTGLRIGHVIFGEWENGKPSSKTPTLGKKILCMSIDRRPLKLFWSIDTSNFGNRMKVGRAIACLCIHGIVDVWKCHNAVNCNHMAILCNILF